jgi:histidinol-phosphatase
MTSDAPADFGPAWSASLARAPESTLREWTSFALELCDAADEIALRHFRRDLDIERKPDRTFVTIADQGIERVIREAIRARYPDHGLVGEEYGTEEGAATTRWFIDPIDGTHNFIRGVPLFGTLLGIEHEGELQVGVISAPAIRERWFAYRGGGAFNRGLDGERRIRVSRVAALEDAQLLYGSARDTAESGYMPGFDALLRAAWRERGFGDFWGYALVAEGHGRLRRAPHRCAVLRGLQRAAPRRGPGAATGCPRLIERARRQRPPRRSRPPPRSARPPGRRAPRGPAPR